jgi:hypothetical protein
VSLRGSYDDPISDEHVGFHFGGVNTWWEVGELQAEGQTAKRQRTDQLPQQRTDERGSEAAKALDWHLASQVRERLQGAIARGEPMHLTAKQQSDEAAIRAMITSSAQNSGRTKALTISNRGRFVLPCELSAFQNTTNICPLGPAFQLSVATLNGEMFITLAYVRPTIDDATGAAVLGSIASTLERAAHAGG